MATNTSTRRGILGAMAALVATPAFALPAPHVPSLSHLMAGGSWSSCVADYRAAAEALRLANVRCASAKADCKAARGKLLIPSGLRSPLLLGAWLKMSAEEIREDLMVRRCGPTTPRKIAIVDQEMRGVPEFKAEYDRLAAPVDAAWQDVDAAEDRFYEAEQRLCDYEVGNLAELSEKLAIAREDANPWLIAAVEADMSRLAGGSL